MKIHLKEPFHHNYIRQDKIAKVREDFSYAMIHDMKTPLSSILMGTEILESGRLDGLPPVKVHCSLLAEEAIHAALWDYAEKNGIKIEGLQKPKNDISEGEEDEEY